MTTGPGIVDRVVVATLTVVDVEVVIGAVVEVLAEVDDVVPAARVRSWLPPPPHAAKASRATAVNVRRTPLVSLYGPARDARASAGCDLRPATGDRPGRRGGGLRRILPLRPPHAFRRRGSGPGPDRVVDHTGRHRPGDEPHSPR